MSLNRPTPVKHLLNALLVDDEWNACKNLDSIIADFLNTEITVCGYAHNLEEAETKINTLKPDLVFLDIELYEGNAFLLLDKIKPASFEIIFVTAYEEYALRALKLNVIDYILKPIDVIELKVAVQKVMDKSISQTAKETSLSEGAGITPQQQLILKDSHNNYIMVKFENLLYIEALKSYSRLVYKHGGQLKRLVMSQPISEYETLLPKINFTRVHRSFLVNYEYIMTVLSKERELVLAENNIHLPISRRKYKEVLLFLKGKKK